MKKQILVGILALGVAFATQAAQIQGVIGFSGSINMDSGDANTATSVTGWHFVGNTGSPYVSIADGDFTPYLGLSASFLTPWVFATLPSNGLWSIGGGDYVFDLLSAVITKQSGGELVIDGTGLISSTLGQDPTPGTWHFTTQNPPSGSGTTATFSFSASGKAVPDGGTSVLLLGVALTGLAALRRKISV